ncbi:MAG: aminopeptidase P family protein [Chloroflexi bacterium]|nr:aminopeptidase P family protein [Chloroflexota bacterium]
MTFGPFNVDYEQRAYNPERMRKERLTRAHAALNKHGLSAVILFDYDNFRYLGFYSRHNYERRRPGRYFLLIKDDGYPYGPVDEQTPTGEEELMPWYKGRLVFKNSKPMTTFRGLNVPYMTDHWDKAAREIKSLLDDHGIGNQPCGVDTCNMFFVEACRKAGIKLVDGNGVMEEARQIKTADEIECLRMAGAITEGAMWEVAHNLRPGITEWEVAGIASKALFQNGAEELEGPSFVICSGERSGHNVPAMPTDRLIRPGDLLIIDINGVSFQGYRTCFYRTFCVGDKPTPFQKEIYHNCYEYMMAMTNAIAPGRNSNEITEIVLNQGEGMWKGQPMWPDWPKPGTYYSPAGHQIGLCSGDPGAPFHNIRARSDPPFTIQKNMCFAIEVGVYTWDGKNWTKDGVKLEHCGVVTDDGFEVFYRFPMKDLIVCGLPGVY